MRVTANTRFLGLALMLCDCSSRVCIPGQSIACTGPAGCSGGQICDSTGSGLGQCDCGDAGIGLDAGTDAGGVDAGAVDSGAVDAGTIDAGTVDAGTVDSGTVDSGTVDSGWTYLEPDAVATSVVVDAQGDIIVLSTNDGVTRSRVRKLSPSGQSRWSTDLPYRAQGALAVSPSGDIFVCNGITFTTEIGQLHKLDSDGGIQWTRTVDPCRGLAVAPGGDIVIAGDKYVPATGAVEGWVRRLDSTGTTERWSYATTLRGYAIFSDVDVAPDGTVFTAGHRSTMPGDGGYVMTRHDPANGLPVWQRETRDLGPAGDTGAEVALDGAGNPIMSAPGINEVAQVRRFTADGGITFSDTWNGRAYGVAVFPGGSSVAVGTTGGEGYVLGHNPAGVPAPPIVIDTGAAQSDTVLSVATMGSGFVVVGYSAPAGGGPRTAWVRVFPP